MSYYEGYNNKEDKLQFDLKSFKSKNSNSQFNQLGKGTKQRGDGNMLENSNDAASVEDGEQSQRSERQSTNDMEIERKEFVHQLREDMKKADHKILNQYYKQSQKSQQAKKVFCCRKVRRSYLRFGNNFQKQKKFALMT
jgi:hypothetical protein